MANRYFNSSRTQQYQFSAPPLDAAVEAMKIAQQQYDQNFMLAADMKNKYISSLQQDRATANSIQNDWQKSIDEAVTKANGDFSSISKDLYGITKKIEKDLSPGGKGYAIQANYAAYQDAQKYNKERLKAGKITAEDFNLLNAHVDQTYKGVGNPDPLTGDYNQILIPQLNDYYDGNDVATELLQKLPKRTVEETTPTVKDGYITYSTKKTERIDPKEAQQALTSKLSNDDKFLQYNMQRAKLLGIDPVQYTQKVISDISTQQVPLYTGTFNDTSGTKISGDPVALQRQKMNNDWAMQKDRQRHAIAMKTLDDKKAEMEAAGQNASNLALVSVSDSSTGRYKAIDQQGMIDKTTGLQLDNNTFSGNMFGASTRVASAGTKTKVNFADVMKNPSKYQGDVNTELVKSIEQQYGNKITEGQKRDLYNKSLEADVYGKGIYVNQYRTPEAQKRDADVLFPRLATGQVGLWKVDTKTGDVQEVTSAQTKKDVYANVYDSEKRHAKQVVIGRTSPQGGGVPYGAYFTDPKDGTAYVLADNEERMNQFNQKERKAAFGYANSDKSLGDPFKLNIGTSQKLVRWEKEYVPDPQTGAMKPRVRYRSMNSEDASDPYLWYRDGDGVQHYYTPAHIEQAILPAQNLPINKRSGTKDYNTNIEYTPEGDQ